MKKSPFGCILHTKEGWAVTFKNWFYSEDNSITLADCLWIEYPFQDRVNYSALNYFQKKEFNENEIVWMYPFSEYIYRIMRRMFFNNDLLPERPIHELNIPSKLNQGVICMPNAIVFAEYINMDTSPPIIDALVFISGFRCFENPNEDRLRRMLASHSKMIDTRTSQISKNLFFILHFGKSDLYNFWSSV